MNVKTAILKSSPNPLLLSLPQFLIFLQHLKDHVSFMFQEKGQVQILPDLLHLSLSLHFAEEVTKTKMLQDRCQDELHYAPLSVIVCSRLGCCSLARASSELCPPLIFCFFGELTRVEHPQEA